MVLVALLQISPPPCIGSSFLWFIIVYVNSVTFSALDKYGESLSNGLNKCWYDDDDDDDDDGEVDGEDEDEYVLAGYGT